MISLTAHHLVAMKDLGVFVHRISAVRNGAVSNVFGENPTQELDERQLMMMVATLQSSLMSKYHDKIELTLEPAQLMTHEELLRGTGLRAQ